ncbi:glycoside hydrolase family 28 protein [Compostibacter hankyongensis]|uniref:Glycoside hydrolase family 28 protein n=1 Tax=Compostibacter hankyongensis TaxID=1007089 RepID=A0ABP8FSJ5_9BACT
MLLSLSASAADINILKYGAKGDGTTLNTVAIQQAIDECSATGGGRVTVPAGIFLSGTLYLKSKVNLFLEAGAVLKGSSRISDYHEVRHTPALIIAEELQQVSVTGPGTIDGNGKAKSFQHGDNAKGRPMLMFFIDCSDVGIKDIRLRSPAFWTQKYLGCDGVLVTGISVYAHANWNNDGIDIDSKNVTVSNCRFDTDDDAICLKSEREEPCENITITNCVAASNCNGIKMGTASSGGFRNISISNCAIHAASEDNIRHWKTTLTGITADKTVISGIAIEDVDGGHSDQINISNITMQSVQTPIFIRLGNRHQPAGSLQHVNIGNIIATSESQMCNIISGIPDADIKDVSIHDIQLVSHAAGKAALADSVPENTRGYPENRMFGQTLPAAGFFIRHAEHIRLSRIYLEVPPEEERPFLVADDTRGLEVNDAGFVKGTAHAFPVLYFMRNAKEAAVTPPMFLPSFDVLLQTEGKGPADIRLFLKEKPARGKTFSTDQGTKKDAVKVFFPGQD